MLQRRLSGLKATLSFAVILAVGVDILEARQCHQCSGINCQRTNYANTVDCADALDICASVFAGQTLEAQGCLEELHESLRLKCSDVHRQDCVLCDEDLCNNVGPHGFQCVQCDSATDVNCRTNPETLRPNNCRIARANNAFCYTQVQGEHITRGCANQLAEQLKCLSDADCALCSPFEVPHCNGTPIENDDDSTTSNAPTPTTNGPPTPTNPGGDTTSSSSSTSTSSRPTVQPPSTEPSVSPPTTINPTPTPTASPGDGGGGSSALQVNALQLLFTLLLVVLVNRKQ